MKQAALIAALSCIGFSVGLAVFVASRLSEQAVALLAGALFGLIVALPIGGVIGWVVKGSRSIERAPSAQPTVIVAQPQLPAPSPYPAPVNPAWRGSAYPVAANVSQTQPRKYTIGGEEVINHESLAVW